MNVKLISLWTGPLPPWHGEFLAQMQRLRTVSWACFPPLGRVEWLNDRATRELGAPSRKGDEQAVCDFRPMFAEMFRAEVEGFDWWGWIDLDVMIGDLDRWLADLLADDLDVLTFKAQHLSGCLTVLRNRPEVNGCFRRGRWREVLADRNYWCWDESGNRRSGGEHFRGLLAEAGLRVSARDDLYVYDAPQEPNPVELRDGDVIELSTGRRVPFCHFMTDVWPVKADGSPREQ